MKRFVLEIELGNAAMETPADVARALEDIAEKLDDRFGDDWGYLARPDESLPVMDINGNRVGEVRVEVSDDD